jgi:hypothetical protein
MRFQTGRSKQFMRRICRKGPASRPGEAGCGPLIPAFGLTSARSSAMRMNVHSHYLEF